MLLNYICDLDLSVQTISAIEIPYKCLNCLDQCLRTNESQDIMAKNGPESVIMYVQPGEANVLLCKHLI